MLRIGQRDKAVNQGIWPTNFHKDLLYFQLRVLWKAKFLFDELCIRLVVATMQCLAKRMSFPMCVPVVHGSELFFVCSKSVRIHFCFLGSGIVYGLGKS